MSPYRQSPKPPLELARRRLADQARDALDACWSAQVDQAIEQLADRVLRAAALGMRRAYSDIWSPAFVRYAFPFIKAWAKLEGLRVRRRFRFFGERDIKVSW